MIDRQFGSDNVAPAHPAVLAAVAEANDGAAASYGDDPWTARVEARFGELLGVPVAVALVTTGTAANVIGLAAIMRSWEGVICAESAHINTDECSAPEAAGIKLLVATTPAGKLVPEQITERVHVLGDVHATQPRVVSISQSTELGTVYRPDEIAGLADEAHRHGMLLHVDGARIGNACAALGVGLRELIAETGVDVLAFGGTKNGAMLAEAVVSLRPDLAEPIGFARKQHSQLVSKGRFIAAQLDALLAGDRWLELAAHANAMARRLGDGLAAIPGVRIAHPVEANAVFVVLPAPVLAALAARYEFQLWDPARGVHRLMASWATTADDVEAVLAVARAAA